MILSEHFDGLPDSVMKYIKSELQAILSKRKQAPKGAWLDDANCSVIRELLDEVKPGWLGSIADLEKP